MVGRGWVEGKRHSLGDQGVGNECVSKQREEVELKEGLCGGGVAKGGLVLTPQQGLMCVCVQEQC